MVLRALLVPITLIAAATLSDFANAQSDAAPERSDVAALPFKLTWTVGVCPNCRVAHRLSSVQFVSPTEAWAIGFNPPGQTGAGDYSVLHSKDGGSSWREIPEPWQHNDSPDLDFADRKDGWLRDMDIFAAEDRLLETHDGGTHWHRIPLPKDLWVRQIEYQGGGVGYGIGESASDKQQYLLATHDHGRQWARMPLPAGFWTELMRIGDYQRNIIVGCIDHQPSTITTRDGGANWTATSLDVPRSVDDTLPLCDFEPNSLDFLDDERGWLVESKHSFRRDDNQGEAKVFATSDGGVTWRAVYAERTLSALDDWFGGVRFLDANLGFIWKEKAGKGVLLYTTDGGGHWGALDLWRPISECRRFDGGLECAVWETGFWVLRISKAN